MLLRYLRHSKFDLLYKEYGPHRNKPLSRTELIDIIKRFNSLRESLGLLGDLGTEGYQLLPAAGAALFQADFKDARLSLRESIRATTEEKRQTQFEQCEREKKLPARIGIGYPKICSRSPDAPLLSQRYMNATRSRTACGKSRTRTNWDIGLL